ncbi:hypothetical protein HXX76_012722 [Chlamydomonas incerta]|uniref:Protein arginine methyltransferase NDUFAF7 n=1 Tax=Chlamydomonas incerta TaxID=51695 RepID=A0A835SW32_CHLIN|nr:hypothetical protein HXX76_012722 [Chlamydomonas incerta]|eukprot:KAG2426936.1 hypothetical protein HXX76_012722 [Chlamydomonas incerta]
MQDCLTSPQGGFYMSRDVFGTAGDFVTSPEISQLFGEMVGIWCVHTWMAMGKPPRLALVELGPGRGTLMADLLRGTAAFKPFAAALEVHLVEVSPALRAAQWRALRCSADPAASKAADDLAHLRAGLPPVVAQQQQSQQQSQQQQPSSSGGDYGGTPEVGVSGFNGCKVRWHATLDAVPDGPGPALYLAHEFFDALPVHQFVRDPEGRRGWLEKLVDVELNEQADERDEQPQQRRLEAPGTSQPSTAGGGGGNGGAAGGGTAHTGSTPAAGSSGAAGVAGAGVAGAPTAAVTKAEAGSARLAAAAASAASGQGHTSGSGLRLVLSPGPTPAAAMLVPRRLAGLSKEQAEQTSAIEISGVGMATAERLAQRVGRRGGAALVMDYGREAPGPYADSLMAIRAHRGVGVLDAPGTADLSAWVDFGALRQAVAGARQQAGAAAATSGPVSQAAWLAAMGVGARFQQLAAGAAAQPAQVEALRAGLERLLDEGENGMGRAYQVMAIHHTDLTQLAGLPPPEQVAPPQMQQEQQQQVQEQQQRQQQPQQGKQ